MTEIDRPQLRLHVEEATTPQARQCDATRLLSELSVAFESATGWLLYVTGPDAEPIAIGDDTAWRRRIRTGSPAGEATMRVERPSGATTERPLADVETACLLADQFADLMDELGSTRLALREREAELAAAVPLAAWPVERQDLSRRLDAVLRTGTQALGCDAAGLYALDEDTRELKLRASWGLPPGRFLAPPRPLSDASADLEALVGHVVTLSGAQDEEAWHPPEPFRAAVCVPVAGPHEIFGTLWCYSKKQLSHSDWETGLAELVAGRLAAELERHCLVSQAIVNTRRDREIDAATQVQREQEPYQSPDIAHWQIAGWTRRWDHPVADFHDWMPLSDDRWGLFIGSAQPGGVAGGFVASAVRLAVRTAAGSTNDAGYVLSQVNSVLHAASPGNHVAEAVFAILEPRVGRLRYGTAGDPALVFVHGDEWKSLSAPDLPLGMEAETDFAECCQPLGEGDVVVLASDGVRDALDSGGRLFGANGVAATVMDHRGADAHEIATSLADRLQEHVGENKAAGQTVIVAKYGGGTSR